MSGLVNKSFNDFHLFIVFSSKKNFFSISKSFNDLDLLIVKFESLFIPRIGENDWEAECINLFNEEIDDNTEFDSLSGERSCTFFGRIKGASGNGVDGSLTIVLFPPSSPIKFKKLKIFN